MLIRAKFLGPPSSSLQTLFLVLLEALMHFKQVSLFMKNPEQTLDVIK